MKTADAGPMIEEFQDASKALAVCADMHSSLEKGGQEQKRGGYLIPFGRKLWRLPDQSTLLSLLFGQLQH